MKAISLTILVAVAALAASASASASVTHPSKTYGITVAGQPCAPFTTDNKTQQTILDTNTAVEVFTYGDRTAYLPDYDQDAILDSDDATVTLGGCPTAGPTGSGADSRFLCYSHFGTDTMPGAYSPADAPGLLAETNTDGTPAYWMASATTRTIAGDTDTRNGVTFVCNPSTAPTGLWWMLDGKTSVDNATEAGIQRAWGDAPQEDVYQGVS